MSKGGRAFLKEQHHGFNACALEGAAGAVKDGVHVATFQQQFAQAHRSVVGVGQEGVLDDYSSAAAGLEHFDEVLKEEKGRFAGADGEILLDFFALLPAEGRVGQDHIHAVFVLNVGEVLGQGVGMGNVGRFNAVQDHIHDRDDVGQRLLFLAVESALLQCLDVAGGKAGLGLEVIERFAQEARRATGTVVDALTDFWLDHLHHGANQRARGVVLAAIPARVAHVLDLGFVQVRQFVLFGLRAEAQFVDVVDDLAQVIAAVDLVLDLAENFANLVFEGIWPAGLLLESVQVRKKLAVHEFAQVVASQRFVVVELAVSPFGRGPDFPAVGHIENEGVLFSLQLGFHGLVLLQAVQKFQEQQPRGLFGVVQFAGTTGLFPEDVVDIFKSLFKHEGQMLFRGDGLYEAEGANITGIDVVRRKA